MPTIILIRHEMPDNPQNIFYGANSEYDFPLSPKGKQKAFNLGMNFAFAGIKLSAIVMSPLARTKQTGEELYRGAMSVSYLAPTHTRRLRLHGNDSTSPFVKYEDPRLIDVRYPELEGNKVSGNSVILDSGKVNLDNMEKYMEESPLKSAKRFANCIKDLALKFEGTIAVVTHFDTIARGVEFLQHGENGIFSITELEKKGGYLVDRGQFVVIQMSSSGLLEGKIYKNPPLTDIPFLYTEGGLRGKEY